MCQTTGSELESIWPACSKILLLSSGRVLSLREFSALGGSICKWDAKVIIGPKLLISLVSWMGGKTRQRKTFSEMGKFRKTFSSRAVPLS